MGLIFLHGLGQTPDSWGKVISSLGIAENSICPNLAELVQGRETTYQNLYTAIEALCNQAEGDLNLCGLSLGGVLALNYAVKYPERVRSLALIAAQYKMPRNLLRLQNTLFRFMPQSAFQQTGFGKAEFLQLCKTMMELDFSGSVSNITCPTLLLCGEKDSANQKASLKLADLLPNAEFQTIDGAGHEVNVEAPEKLAEVLHDFFVDKAKKVW